MYKVGVVGDRDSVLAFKALGLEVATCTNPEESRRAVDKMARNEFGIIFITEQLANQIPETINRYNSTMVPAIILIPSNQGTLNIGMDRINENVEKAIGSKIL